ncbi:hypothetical protein PV728_15600 [Streptomyces europaeiscabiei]|uniref:hypothetical protein n=1 Tax=Streptomyces TaxID=1883 RepID=UPI000A368907|nr:MULTISPECIES: hypothetical protein [Streptomyces]MDX3631680.1 hypothetical protein [Streptomyces europaeiscabiei]MDX3649461.1 hypothetical protein [Streptomyces europaeiscabiei]WUD34463.1 hypothetical protein OG858_25695 [Streptomyces europaeiscabiei]
MTIYDDHPTDPRLEAISLRVSRQHLRYCFEKGIVPHIEDSTRVMQAAYDAMTHSGNPLDAPGERLYLLSFEGIQSYIKVGRVSKRLFPARLSEYEHAAELGMVVIFDGWVSKARPSTRLWETRARDAIAAVPGVQRTHKEYFSGIAFEDALAIVQRERTA